MGSKGEISEAVAAEDASSQRTGTRRTIAIVLVLTTRKLPCPTQVVPEVASLPRRHSHVRSRGASRARTGLARAAARVAAPTGPCAAVRAHAGLWENVGTRRRARSTHVERAGHGLGLAGYGAQARAPARTAACAPCAACARRGVNVCTTRLRCSAARAWMRAPDAARRRDGSRWLRRRRDGRVRRGRTRRKPAAKRRAHAQAHPPELVRPRQAAGASGRT